MNTYKQTETVQCSTNNELTDNPIMKALFKVLKEYSEKTANSYMMPNIFIGIQADKEESIGKLHFMVTPKK